LTWDRPRILVHLFPLAKSTSKSGQFFINRKPRSFRWPSTWFDGWSVAYFSKKFSLGSVLILWTQIRISIFCDFPIRIAVKFVLSSWFFSIYKEKLDSHTKERKKGKKTCEQIQVFRKRSYYLNYRIFRCVHWLRWYHWTQKVSEKVNL